MASIPAVMRDERSRDRERSPGAVAARPPEVARLLALQRGAGNQAVARMLARRTLARAFDPYVVGAPVTAIDDADQKLPIKTGTRCEVDLANVRKGPGGLMYRIRLIDDKSQGWIDQAAYVTLQALDFEIADVQAEGDEASGEGATGELAEAQPVDDTADPVVALGNNNVPVVAVTPALRMRYQQDLRRINVYLEEREGDALARHLDVFARVMRIEAAPEEPKVEATTTTTEKSRTPKNRGKEEKPAAQATMLTETLSYGDAGAAKKGFIAFTGAHYIVLKRLAKHAKGTYVDKDGYGYNEFKKTRGDGSCLVDALHIVRGGKNASDEEVLAHRAYLASLDDPLLDALLESLVLDLLAGKAVLGLGPAVRRYLERNTGYKSARDTLREQRAEREERSKTKEAERKEKSDAYSEAHKPEPVVSEKQPDSKPKHLKHADVSVVETQYHKGEMRVGTGQGAEWVKKGEVAGALPTITKECSGKHFDAPHHATKSNYWQMAKAFGRPRGRVSLDLEAYQSNLPRWQRVKLQPGNGQQGGWLLYVPEDGSTLTYDADIMLTTLTNIVSTASYHLVYPKSMKPAPEDPQVAAEAKAKQPAQTGPTKQEKYRKKLEARSKK